MSGFSRLLKLHFVSVPFVCVGLSVAGQTPAGGKVGAAFSSTEAELRARSAAVPADPEFGSQILLEEGTYTVGESGTLRYKHG